MGNKERIIKFIKKNPHIYRFISKTYSRYNNLLNYHWFRMLSSPFNGYKESKKNPKTIKTYCIENSIERHIYEPEQDRYEYEAAYFEKANDCYKTFRTQEIYSCVLEDINVLGGDDLLFKDDYALTDRYTFSVGEHLVFLNMFKNKDNTYTLYSKEGFDIEEGIHLMGQGCSNYYHWTFDILGKMAFINKHPELANTPLILSKTISRHENYLKQLKLVDKYNHPVIYVDDGQLCKVKKLYYFSPCTWTNCYTDDSIKMGQVDFCLVKSMECIDMYRDAVLPLIDKTKKYPKKIFLKRGSKYSNRLVNREEVMNYLAKEDFAFINPSEYSLIEMAGYFNNADIIMCDSGAQFVNELYAGNNTLIACIIPLQYHYPQYSNIVHMAGGKSIFLDANPTGEWIYINLDMNYLKRFIKAFNNKEFNE